MRPVKWERGNSELRINSEIWKLHLDLGSVSLGFTWLPDDNYNHHAEPRSNVYLQLQRGSFRTYWGSNYWPGRS